MKIYFDYNGKSYHGYDFYMQRYEKSDIVFLSEELKGKLFSSYIKSFIPQKGMKAYVCPGSKRAVADIRKDYTIKLNPLDADFIIGSQNNDDYVASEYCSRFYIIESRKAVVGFNSHSYYNKFNTIDDYTESLFPYINPTKEPIISVFSPPPIYAFNAKSITPAINNYFNWKKPFVYFSDVPVYSNNDLEIDTLQLVFKTGIADITDNNQQNFIVQLQALNQTNWREYPEVLKLLYRLITYKNDYVAKNVFDHESRLPKSVKEMCKVMRGYPEFKTNKELAIAYQLFNSIMQLDVNKCYTVQELTRMFSDADIPFTWFYNLFDNIVKVRLKCLE